MWRRQARKKLKQLPAASQGRLEKLIIADAEPMRLVLDDTPIRGRVLDINGQPVATARVTLMRAWASNDDDLGPWREALTKPEADFYSARMTTPRNISGPQVRTVVRPALTDSDGRFILRGVGSGRLVRLLVEGPGVQSDLVLAGTEPGEAIEVVRGHRSPHLGSWTWHAAEFTHIAGPSRSIVGVVRDAESGDPLPGVTVKSQKRHGEPISGWGQDFVRAVTDAQGRYTLNGMPVGDENRLATMAPDGDTPYFSKRSRADTSVVEGSLTIDFDLDRGVWVEGRITDKATGKGLPGKLAYYVSRENGKSKLARSLSTDERDRLRADAKGRFRIAALPGLGYVAFTADDHETYPRTRAIRQPDGTEKPIEESMISTVGTYLMPTNYYAVALVDPEVDAAPHSLNLMLDAGQTLEGRVVGSDGQAINDFVYTGWSSDFPSLWRQSDGDRLTLIDYRHEQPRAIYVMTGSGDLAGHTVVSGEQEGPVTIQLQPAGSVTARLVDADGEPIDNARLFPWRPRRDDEIRSFDTSFSAAPLPRNRESDTQGDAVTDAQGRFTLKGLAPGATYRLIASDPTAMRDPKRRRFEGGPIDAVIRVDPDESLDLGDVRLAPDAEEFNKAAVAPRQEEAAPTAEGGTSVTGVVTLAGGKPAAGANVAVVATVVKARSGGDLGPRSALLAEAKTDASGRFTLPRLNIDHDAYQHPRLIARRYGTGVTWQALDLGAPPADVSLALPGEAPIKLRLIGIEGRSAAGVRVVPRGLSERGTGAWGRDPNRFCGHDGDATLAWLPAAIADEEGRLVVRGVPEGFGLYAKTPGDDRFAPQDLMLNTGQPEQRGERDGTYLAIIKNVKGDEEMLLALAPAQVFEGTVTYEDTGEPAPNARLTIWASQQPRSGSMVSVAGKADANGRYRITPRPGVRFGVNAYPADGEPYLVRRTPSDKAIHWIDGDRVKEVDAALPRGVMVRGRVIGATSGEGIEGVSVQYRPESNNNPNTADDILTGWQAIVTTDAQGRYAIAVLPGPGHLVATAAADDFVVESITEREMSRGERGGARQYAHAFERIELETDESPVEIDLTLTPGDIASGRLVDESGVTVDRAFAYTWLKTSPHTLGWRGRPIEVNGGQFALGSLSPDQPHPVSFLDPDRKLGATAEFRAGETDREVAMRPCGSAAARFVDASGEPAGNQPITVYLVVRPGPDQFDWAAARRGELAADADYISNVDRLNYGDLSATDTDADGVLELPVLIPNATYRLLTREKGRPVVIQDFQVAAGERSDLGEFTLQVEED